MNIRAVWMRGVAAAGALSALALVAGCGGDSGSDSAGRQKAASPATPSARTEAALSQPDLDRLALSPSDVTGYTVKAVEGKGAPVDHGFRTRYDTVTPASCRPIYAAAELRSLHDFTAHVSEDVVSSADAMAQHASVSLTSYTGADAGKVISELRFALSQCTTAAIRPSAARPGDELGYSSPYQRTAPGAGDDAIAFDASQVIVGVDAPVIPMTVVVVRKGSTVATFMTLDPTDETPAIPEDILDTQLKKLAADPCPPVRI
jgi:hypothetical protein